MANKIFLSNADSPLPLYHRLYVILKEKILNGDYSLGDLLPPEAELIKLYGVSRITAKRALDELANDGFVQRERGKGTFVIKDKKMGLFNLPIQANIQGLMSNLTSINQETTLQVKSFGYYVASPWVCQQLQIEKGSIVQEAVRIRFFKESPFSISTSYVPEEIGRRYDGQDLEKNALIDLLQNTGNAIQNVRQTITCILANDKHAHNLNVLVGSPLLKLRRIFFNDKGLAVNYSEILYSPDRFEYNMDLVFDPDNKN